MRKLIRAINWEIGFPAIYVLVAATIAAYSGYALGHSQASADTAARVERRTSEEAQAAARRLHELANAMQVYPFERGR